MINYIQVYWLVKTVSLSDIQLDCRGILDLLLQGVYDAVIFLGLTQNDYK